MIERMQRGQADDKVLSQEEDFELRNYDTARRTNRVRSPKRSSFRSSYSILACKDAAAIASKSTRTHGVQFGLSLPGVRRILSREVTMEPGDFKAADFEKIEEELRSEIYATLVELGLAKPEEKAELAKRLNAASDKMYALIVHGQIPDG